MSTVTHQDTDSDDNATRSQQRRKFFILLIGCIGVVFGDIGTSPLYAFREAIHHLSEHGILPSEVYGILSLIFWSLVIIVTMKYVLLLLHADNKGEGGILTLMTLVRKSYTSPTSKDVIMLIGIMGASLFYADAAITPAISVLSAVEGLKLVTPMFEPYVLTLSIIILIFLFSFQKYGTAKVSTFFGPITIVWFVAMAATGVYWIVQNPLILFCLNPYYAALFIVEHEWLSFFVLGSIFLAVTGAEALYADMGHFGFHPIQRAWIFFIFPCLLLNYLGQGALVLIRPEAASNPFFLMVPDDFLLPMVLLATCATIIASQAVITGAFSLSRQAIQLGFLPRMEIRYTSEDNMGQIYMPKINSLLLYGVLFLCILFQNSSGLAAAYGIAVCGTMVITTILTYIVITRVWKKSVMFALCITVPLIVIELIFLSANMLRLFHGGIVPLFLGAYISFLMVTWIFGTRYLAKRAGRKAIRITDFSETLDQSPPHIVKGTAVFFTADPLNTPEALIKNLQYNQIIHEHNFVVTVITSSFPEVPENQRLHIETISSKLVRVVIHFGFMETPDVPRALRQATWQGMDIDLQNATFYLVRRKIVSDPHRGLPGWMDKVYISLTRVAIGEHDFFKLPRTRVVELGVQMTI